MRVKGKDWEASFRLEKAEQEAAALPEAPHQPESVPTPEEEDRFEQIAELSPVAAILEQRRALEEVVLTRVAQLPNVPSPKQPSLLAAIRVLRARDAIDAHTSAILDDLRNVGNAAAHGSADGLTKKDAMRYRRLVKQVIDRLSYS